MKNYVIKNIRSATFFFYENQITLAEVYFLLIFHLMEALNVFVLNAVFLSQNFFYFEVPKLYRVQTVYLAK